jgi:hypothetical protein
MFTLAGILSQSDKYRYLLILEAYLKRSNISVVTQNIIFMYTFVYILFEGHFLTSNIYTQTEVEYIIKELRVLVFDGYLKYSNILNSIAETTIPNVFSAYDQLILNDSPLIYFPLHTMAQSISNTTNLWGYNNYTNGFTFNSYTYSELPFNQNQPILLKDGSPAHFFTNLNSVISIPKNLDSRLNLHQNKSVEFWFLFSENNTGEIFADRSVNNSDPCQFSLMLNYVGRGALNRLTFGRFDGTAWSIREATEVLAPSVIYYVVITWSATELKFYINGTLDSTHDITGWMFSEATGNIYIGRGHNDLFATDNRCKYPISNFGIYDKVLTPAEVLSHYISGVRPENYLSAYDKLVLAKTPIIYFPLHKNSQSKSSKGGYWGYKNYANGFVFNGYTYNSLPDISTQPVIVKDASSANVFSTSSTIAIPKSLSSTLDMNVNKSIEFWFRLLDYSPTCFIADRYQTGNSSQIVIGLNISQIRTPDNRLFIGSVEWRGFLFVKHWVANTIPLLNTNYHAVFTYTSTVTNIYLNGVLDRTVNTGETPSTGSKTTGIIYVGRGYDDTAIAAALCDQPISNIAIYNRILTDAEVLNHYNAGLI